MKNQNLKLAFIAFTTLLSFNSCKKAIYDLAPADKEKNSTSALDYIKSLGFHDSDIKDIGTDYLVDGDMLFSKKTVVATTNGNASKIKTDQYGAQNYLGLNTNVVINIDASMSAYTAEINAAIAQWNGIPNCRVKFSVGSSYNVTIMANNNIGGACGQSYFPINGQPGFIIYISPAAISGNSFDQRQRTIAHELGHSIGLRHTNWFLNEPQNGTAPNSAHYSATHILGTPTEADPVSLMNGNECGTGATVLSNYDKIAVQFLYPLNPPVAGTSPVFRYYNGGSSDHFYTTDYNELAQGNNTGYIFEGVGFFAFTTQVAGTEPVYRYYSSSAVDHFYTRNATTPGGYIKERVAFYAYPSQANSSVPVYRYYHGGTPAEIDHFYTKNQNEFYWGAGGYAYEDVPFYAY
ncbi:M57 family metalloprotease [Mucilaginibacter sp. R-33]|uniref:M57 family metalloprotease n=1 Tax=unclassified Mucilaginibacter TaxID=2617802 RepID=UPI003CFAFEC1